MSRLVLAVVAGALLCALPAEAQRAQPPGRGGGGGREAAPQEVQPLNSILQRLRGRIAGRVLDADLSPGPGGRAVYNVRTLERDGRERVFTIDARSGEVLGERGGR